MKTRLELFNPEDDFRALPDNLIDDDNDDTFEVLVRDRLNRNPITHEAYPHGELQEEPFVLNRNRYHQRSKWSREELEEAESNSSDPDTPTRIILENHVPEDFATYMRFVETGSLDMAADDKDDPFFPLLRLYVLADHLSDFTIANRIINRIMKVSKDSSHTPSKKEIWFVWEMIEDFEDPLRRLFVDYQIHEAPKDSLLFEDYEHIPFDYLNDVVLMYWDLAKDETDRRQAERDDEPDDEPDDERDYDIFEVKCLRRSKCHYHRHDMDSFHLSCEELGLLRDAEDSE
jgi:hypothetical protein